MNAPITPNPNHYDQPQSGHDQPLPGSERYPQGPEQHPPGQDRIPHPPQSHRTSAANGQQTDEDPGRVLGIISLVATLSTFVGFNFIGPVIGIVTGHLARRRSREDGRADNEMGRWGFILGIVFLGLLVIGWMLGISLTVASGLAGVMAG